MNYKIRPAELDTMIISIDHKLDCDKLETKLQKFDWFVEVYETRDDKIEVEVAPDWQDSWESIDDHYDELEAITLSDIIPKIQEAAE